MGVRGAAGCDGHQEQESSKDNMDRRKNALRSSVAHHEQKRKLERSKTEDCLKRKLHSRPARSELLERHILQDSALQLKQKRTRLAEELNEKISQRPGPLELLHKNILAVPTRPCDTHCLQEENESNNGSPPTATTPELCPVSRNSSASFPQDTSTETTISQPKSSSSKQSRLIKSLSREAFPGRFPRPRKNKESRPKERKLKYHQYIPPDQRSTTGRPSHRSSAPAIASAYARILQQQQMFLQLQILSQQQQREAVHHPCQTEPTNNIEQARSKMAEPTSTKELKVIKTEPKSWNSPGREGEGTTDAQSQPAALPVNLHEMRVSELRQELRTRGLPVSGTKPALMERLRHTQSLPVPLCVSLRRSTADSGGASCGSSSSSPQPISPAMSDRSSVPSSDTTEASLSPMTSAPAGGNCGIGMNLEQKLGDQRDRLLIEKHRKIEELMRLLELEQQQAEELRCQIEREKKGQGLLPSQMYLIKPSLSPDSQTSPLTTSTDGSTTHEISSSPQTFNTCSSLLNEIINYPCHFPSGLSIKKEPPQSPPECHYSQARPTVDLDTCRPWIEEVEAKNEPWSENSSLAESTVQLPFGASKSPGLPGLFAFPSSMPPTAKAPPSYDDAVRYAKLQLPQESPQQQMDDLLDILIRNGEISPCLHEDEEPVEPTASSPSLSPAILHHKSLNPDSTCNGKCNSDDGSQCISKVGESLGSPENLKVQEGLSGPAAERILGRVEWCASSMDWTDLTPLPLALAGGLYPMEIFDPINLVTSSELF
uniref:myocardin-related transcription factor A-like isoform X2 n=1 Tax=Myxine glutinosa TaxID=7769 RepID=UPI00358EEA3F